MSVLGGIIGIGMGISGSWLVSGVTGWVTEISPETMLLSLAFAGSVGIFFGFYPARKASGLNPIDALRYE